MLQIFSPFDRHLIKEIDMNTDEEAEQLLQQAFELFQDRSKWLTPFERINILEKAATLLQSRIEELTIQAALEGGKPYIDSRIEAERAVNSIRIAIECMGRSTGQEIPMGLNKASEHRVAFTVREPIGVVFSICAFNHPLNLVIHQTVTAIAAGCPVIIKPAATTPMSCLSLVGILHEAGLPKGWCEALVCSNEVAEAIACDKRVSYLSFIGSAKVGWYLRSRLCPGTRCGLEHGGAAPVIVEKDASIDILIPAMLKGGFYHAGQVCVSVQRIFVHQAVVNEVAGRLTEGAEKLIVGDPLDELTEVGPLILPKEADRVQEWVKEAVESGGQLLCGGTRLSETSYSPTVILDPPANVRLSSQEVFGPVVCVYSYAERREAIRLANSLDLHFQAAVFTSNIDVALDCAKNLNATGVMINDHTAFRVDWMPFGGRDASGLGMGGIPYTIEEMEREKLIVIKSASL